MDRRKMLKLAGYSAGGLGALALGANYVLLPPRPSRRLRSVRELCQRLYDAVDEESRAGFCVPYDHPLRQYHNRGLWCGGKNVWRHFGRSEAQLVVDLFHAGLSPAGRERVPRQYFLRWPGVHSMDLLFCGNPHEPSFLAKLSAPHLNLRLGGRDATGVAFGGPQVYGDQRGDGRPGLPGNRYRYQLELARRLFEALTPGERERATFANEPIQTQIELRGSGRVPPGASLAEVSDSARAHARALVDAVLENYPEDEAAFAREAIEANGGVAGLSLSHYENGEEGRSYPYQIFRLEGPGAVIHYRGHPHLHAFLNVARDGDRPLSVGAPLGENPAPLAGAAVQRFFENALRHETGASVAYYPPSSVVGRLRAGHVREGDLYNLESWQNAVAVVEVDPADATPRLHQALEAAGESTSARARISVATPSYTAQEEAETLFGRVRSRRSGRLLRLAAIDYVRAVGWPAPDAG